MRGRRKHFLTSQPSEIGANVREGANPIRLCRKWQSPGRHPPGEDTRGYAPHTCPGARGAGTDGEHRSQLGKGHGGDNSGEGMSLCPAWKCGTAKSLHSSRSHSSTSCCSSLVAGVSRSFQVRSEPNRVQLAPERCQTPGHTRPLLSSRRKIIIQAVNSLKIEFY